MDIGKVFVDSVIVGQRHRALEISRVEALAESMDTLGLHQPITVFMDDTDAVHLIAGLHRLEAARKLRWEQVEASFVSLSPAKREMWEIAENLFRVDLSKDQRDQHIRRYAELIEKIECEASENQVSQNAAPEIGYCKPPSQKKGTARKIADETGLSVDTVRRALNPAPKPPKIAADPINPELVHEAQVASLMSAWNKASHEARQDFLGRIDTPVFDRSAA